MSKYVIDSSTLVGIADAIRTKDGSTGVIQVSDFPARISAIEGGGTGGGIDVKYILENAAKIDALNYGGMLDKYYNQDSITLNLKNNDTLSNGISNIFKNSTLAKEMNINIDCGTNWSNGSSAFTYFCDGSKAEKITLHISNFPTGYKMMGITNFCNNCENLKEVNDDIFDFIDNLASNQKPTNIPGVFHSCYNLKKLPTSLSKLLVNSTSSSAYWGWQYLLRLENMNTPICPSINPTRLVVYYGDYSYMYMLKHLIFTNPANVTYTGAASSNANYRKLRLSQYVGWCSSSNITKITDIQNGTLKEVTDAATYQQYKNSGYYTKNSKYSHYNKLSAIETLNSLPDVSAIGGTWTVEFKGDAGELTDGGAINTMTEAEMAGAVAKGWTITFI